MANPAEELVNNPMPNYIFLLRVDAVYDLPCTKVSGIAQEKEYENIMEGGVNDYVQLREKPASKPSILQVERYIGEQHFDPLPVGYQCQMPLVLYVGRYVHDFNHAVMTFTFSGAVVTSKKYGELDAEKGGLMSVTTEIAYQQVTVENANAGEIRTPWEFDSTGMRFQGKGKRYAVYDHQELRKAEMERIGLTRRKIF